MGWPWNLDLNKNLITLDQLVDMYSLCSWPNVSGAWTQGGELSLGVTGFERSLFTLLGQTAGIEPALSREELRVTTHKASWPQLLGFPASLELWSGSCWQVLHDQGLAGHCGSQAC